MNCICLNKGASVFIFILYFFHTLRHAFPLDFPLISPHTFPVLFPSSLITLPLIFLNFPLFFQSQWFETYMKVKSCTGVVVISLRCKHNMFTCKVHAYCPLTENRSGVLFPFFIPYSPYFSPSFIS